ncbi:AI-2E family transporter [Ferruginibacter paludis]|uniref:AI-2E family transporter n=1 Tax=Ferruginibacter paludis TaxID=1310417 RepID=UPI0025B5811D|nr:AI-2E family transporter [Ferruginibacter paludis]MDN3656438.1 AI-2E family transporter [Ferruginibacter paludis]
MIKKYPFYLKSTVVLFGLILFVFMLFNLKAILVPLAFSILLGVLLNPLVNRLQLWGLNKIWAISLSLLIAFIFISGIVYFIMTELNSFGAQLPVIKTKFWQLTATFQHYVSTQLHVPIAKQQQYIAEAENGIKPIIAATLGTVMGTLGMVFLLPVYTYLFLYYKILILNFLYEIFSENNSKEVSLVLKQTKGAIQNYMFGLILEALIVATLNSTALLLLGVDYAILIGLLGAILNILPFIGGIIAVLLPLFIATITKDGYHTQIGITLAYLVIQFIDNHFLVPFIVSSKVKINALISLVIVLLGNAVWGIPGMFLSIPFIGILKIIFDRLPELKPWGKLLGDEIPTRHKGQVWNLRKKRNTAINSETESPVKSAS